MFENIISNNGFVIALSGLIVVFSGLVLIAVVITIFNRFFERERKQALDVAADKRMGQRKKEGLFSIKFGNASEIPDEHIAAITVALELYRKLHYDSFPREMTFNREAGISSWKAGVKFGHRTQ